MLYFKLMYLFWSMNLGNLTVSAVVVVAVPCVLKTFHKGTKYFALYRQKTKQGNNTSSPNFATLTSLPSGVCCLLVFVCCFFGCGVLFLGGGGEHLGRGIVYFCWFVLVCFFVCWVLVFYSVHELTRGFFMLHRFHFCSMSQIYFIADSYYSPATVKIFNCKTAFLFKFKKHSTMYFSNVQAKQCIKIKTQGLLILHQPVP